MLFVTHYGQRSRKEALFATPLIFSLILSPFSGSEVEGMFIIFRPRRNLQLWGKGLPFYMQLNPRLDKNDVSFLSLCSAFSPTHLRIIPRNKARGASVGHYYMRRSRQVYSRLSSSYF